MRASVAGRTVRRIAAFSALTWWAVLVGLFWISPPAGDDAYHHAILAVEQAGCWKEGVIWPRYHPDWNDGTGSFLPTVYAPLAVAVDGAFALAVGEGSRALGVALAFGLAAGTWLLVGGNRSVGWIWLVAAYPLAAVVARATVTEIWALALVVPVVRFGLPPGPRTRTQGIALALAVAVLPGFQVGAALMLAWVLAAGWLVGGSGPLWRRGLPTAAWVLAGFAAGGLLWLPTVMDMRWMARDRLLAGEYSWSGHWATSVAGNVELGPAFLAAWIGLLVLLVVAAVAGLRQVSERRSALTAALAVCLMLSTPLSVVLWRVIPLMPPLQFPWRFLGPATVVAILLAGEVRGIARWVAVAALVVPSALVPVEVSLGPAGLETGMPRDVLARKAAATFRILPILPSMPGFYSVGFDPIDSRLALAQQGATVRERVGGGCQGRSFRVEPDGNGRVLLPVQAWPEWEVSVDGRRATAKRSRGLVALALPPGTHEVGLALGTSRSRRWGRLISAAGVLSVLLLAALSGRTRQPPSRSPQP